MEKWKMSTFLATTTPRNLVDLHTLSLSIAVMPKKLLTTQAIWKLVDDTWTLTTLKAIEKVIFVTDCKTELIAILS